VAADGKDFIWWNGKLVPYAEAKTHVLSHGLHYGTGVFEGIRAYKQERGTAIFRLREHIERAVPLREVLPDAHAGPPRAGDRGLPRGRPRSTRWRRPTCGPLAFLGHGQLGVFPKGCPTEIIVAVMNWGAYLGPDALENGIRCTLSSWHRLHHEMFPTTAKGAGQYMNSYLAVSEAKAKGFDEAILLDRHGNISEGSGENIFVIRSGVISTPGLDSSILPGITRDTVMTLARGMGIPVEVRSITRGELYTADELFFTGTAAEVSAIREVDGYVIGSGKRGPITKRLQDAFFAVVRGKDASRSSWLTPV